MRRARSIIPAQSSRAIWGWGGAASPDKVPFMLNSKRNTTFLDTLVLILTTYTMQGTARRHSGCVVYLEQSSVSPVFWMRDKQSPRSHLSHEHLEEALLEIAHLSPYIFVSLARARYMVQRRYQAMPGHQPAPVQQILHSSHES